VTRPKPLQKLVVNIIESTIRHDDNLIAGSQLTPEKADNFIGRTEREGFFPSSANAFDDTIR